LPFPCGSDLGLRLETVALALTLWPWPG